MIRPVHLLPLIAAASPAWALSVKDDELVVGLKAQLQVRANLINDGTDTVGGSFDPIRGGTGDAEDARYVVRRAMFGLNAKYGQHFRGVFQVRGAENTARTGTGATDPLNVWFAVVEGNVDTGAINHALRLGLDKAFNTESSISSTDYLFPTDRPVAAVAVVRGVGAGYKLTGPCFALGFDHQNNSTGSKDPQAYDQNSVERENGNYWSARLEVSPGKDWWIKKRTESFLGRAGTEALLGIDVGYDDDSISDNGSATTITSTDKLTWGPDLLVHWEKVSLLAEVRWTRSVARAISNTTAVATETQTNGVVWNIQAGYAIPLTSVLLEPCFRYSRIDNKRQDGDELVNYNTATGAGENGQSGRQWDLGLNTYWFYKGHDLKTQIAFSRWQAEAGEGDATFLRIQQQLAF